MHMWGDNWKHWNMLNEAVNDCIKLVAAAGLETCWIKEKYGTLRWYWTPTTPEERQAYRKVYKTLIDKYPEIIPETINSCDNYEELIGLIDPDKCDHKNGIWTHSGAGENGADKDVCHLCGKVVKP